jgi:hypothetical protein
MSSEPQLKQNLFDGSLGVAHLGQTLARGVPQLEQKA